MLAPWDSPNTDGFDPESCRDVLLSGARFSLGDDCIAVKSGKIYMGSTYRTPCENLRITHCLMENGHGAVTIGSEMAGGVRGLTVEDCLFRTRTVACASRPGGAAENRRWWRTCISTAW